MLPTRLTYVGPPAYTGDLVQALEARGISVEYQPPMETKDLATAMAAVSVILTATGPVPDIVATVRAFTSRFAGTRVEDLPHEASSSVRERLAQLEQLYAQGVITEAEHAQQRARILGDL
jgi:hypothetical protein